MWSGRAWMVSGVVVDVLNFCGGRMARRGGEGWWRCGGRATTRRQRRAPCVGKREWKGTVSNGTEAVRMKTARRRSRHGHIGTQGVMRERDVTSVLRVHLSRPHRFRECEGDGDGEPNGAGGCGLFSWRSAP